jgi:hypothetical protein
MHRKNKHLSEYHISTAHSRITDLLQNCWKMYITNMGGLKNMYNILVGKPWLGKT